MNLRINRKTLEEHKTFFKAFLETHGIESEFHENFLPLIPLFKKIGLYTLEKHVVVNPLSTRANVTLLRETSNFSFSPHPFLPKILIGLQTNHLRSVLLNSRNRFEHQSHETQRKLDSALAAIKQKNLRQAGDVTKEFLSKQEQCPTVFDAYKKFLRNPPKGIEQDTFAAAVVHLAAYSVTSGITPQELMPHFLKSLKDPSEKLLLPKSFDLYAALLPETRQRISFTAFQSLLDKYSDNVATSLANCLHTHEVKSLIHLHLLEPDVAHCLAEFYNTRLDKRPKSFLDMVRQKQTTTVPPQPVLEKETTSVPEWLKNFPPEYHSQLINSGLEKVIESSGKNIEHVAKVFSSLPPEVNPKERVEAAISLLMHFNTLNEAKIAAKGAANSQNPCLIIVAGIDSNLQPQWFHPLGKLIENGFKVARACNLLREHNGIYKEVVKRNKTDVSNNKKNNKRH